jgi:hypothetical protein
MAYLPSYIKVRIIVQLQTLTPCKLTLPNAYAIAVLYSAYSIYNCDFFVSIVFN